MDDNKQKALAAALGQIEKQFGKGAVMRLGDSGVDTTIGVISTGSLSLDIALGGIAEKPGVIDGRIEIREYLCVTLSFDHDVIDGAPAARFTQRFKELIETGYGLGEITAG